jgi:type IV pilus secretin PilQ/predicted competence protein
MWRRNANKFSLLLCSVLILSFLLMTATAQEKGEPGEPIKTLQFQSAEIRSVLTFLADYGGVNVVVAPTVEGTVTIKLHDVEWRKAMAIIGRTYDLAVVDEDNYIRVLPAEEYRKELTEQKKHNVEQRQLVELETRIIKISNSTAQSIVETVKSLMTDRGIATADSRSNSIVLQEVPSNIQTVVNYIKELDQPARQIKISAQLLEISNTNLTELGVDWTVEAPWSTESGRSGFHRGEVMAGNTDVVGRYTLGAIQHGWTVDAIIEAIVTTGKGKIVAHPEITTLDNTEARIQMGQKVPVKQFDESGNVVIKFEEAGTILVATPHITAENQILMHLRPERSTFEFNANGVVINTNNAETHVIVENGQTAVIGGLTTQDEVETVTGVPILKDIPLLGVLFRNTKTRSESRDLVIFVTPTIVGEDLAMKD